MFAATVLLTSTAIMTIPQASALEPSRVATHYYISTASYGNSKVCGDHLCAPGEHTGWYNALWQTQRVNSGKLAPDTHGEDIMHELAGSGNSKNTFQWNTPVNQQTPQKGYK